MLADKFVHPMDLKMAADGSLYLLEYGSEWWFGTNGKVIPDNVPLAVGGTSNNSISIVVAGVDRTAEFMAKATYLADDPSQPYFPQSPIPTTARWTDSLNWKWDPATWTGDTWLPAGAVVTIKRHVTYAGCVGGGFAAGVDTYRGYGMAIEIARPGTRTSATAATSFKLPGLAPDAPKCESTLYYTQASNNATTAGSYQLGWFDWPNGTTWRLESIDPGGKTWTPQAIAVSRQVPEMLYYNSRNTGENWFNWYNTSTNQGGDTHPDHLADGQPRLRSAGQLVVGRVRHRHVVQTDVRPGHQDARGLGATREPARPVAASLWRRLHLAGRRALQCRRSRVRWRRQPVGRRQP